MKFEFGVFVLSGENLIWGSVLSCQGRLSCSLRENIEIEGDCGLRVYNGLGGGCIEV